MKSTKLFLLFFLIIFLNNCSHTHKEKIDAVVSPDQMTDYEGVVTSEKKHTVSLAYYDLGMLNNKTKFKIMVENHGDKPVDFSNDNISVIFEGNSIDWSFKKIEIETPNCVMRNIVNEIRSLSTMNSRHYIHARDAINDLAGGTYDFEHIVWMLEAQKEVFKIVDGDIRTKKAQSSYALPRMLIRPQIIMPNESMSGFFVCDTRKMKKKVKGNFIVSVRVDDEEHKFIFSRS